MFYKYIVAITLFCLVVPSLTYACSHSEDSTRTDISSGVRPKVYIDCNHCDIGYTKEKIRFIDYVRDLNDADVDLMIRRFRTASGGHEYTLKFLGRKKFDGHNDTLTYISSSTDTWDTERKGLVRKIKLGLIPYVMNSELANQIRITYTGKAQSKSPAERKDQWDHWVFRIDAGGDVNGKKTQKGYSLNSSLSAERITDKWKIRFHFHGDYDHEKYFFSDGTSETALQNDESYNGLIAKSLSPRWSLGLYSNVRASTYDNIKLSAGASPALEYNIFPYSEYTRHELSFRYTITPYYSNYIHETVYLKNYQTLVKEQLSIHFNLTEPWGEINSNVKGSNLFSDFTKNRLDFNTSLDIQIFRGLSVHFWGHYSLINDQLSLSSGGATNEQVLLNLTQQATSYSYRASVGLRYTFGSIYNNTVNTRF